MGYPELDHDESIILETRNIKFKSISFDGILTNKRIILTDSKKNVIPSQDIALSTIRNVETGENAIRDHFLILSIITDSGEKHQTVLTFVRQAGGERKRECSEWAKKLKTLTPGSTVVTPADKPLFYGESGIKSDIMTPSQSGATKTRPAKKKIETAQPLSKITEKTPIAPKPKETSSLPTGSFCSRCGNRIPYKSTFCNHCGTPVKSPSELTSVSKQINTQEPVLSPVSKPVGSESWESVPPSSAQPVIPKVPVTPSAPLSPVTRVTLPFPAPTPVAGKAPEIVQPATAPPAKTRVPVPPQAGSVGEHQSSQINQIIHSIEPLIEDSVPRTQQSAPLVQKQTYPEKTEPAAPETQAASSSQVVWPVLPSMESPLAPTPESTAVESGSPSPLPLPGPEGKKPNYLAIGILIIAIIPIIAGLVIVANIMSGPSGVSPVTTNSVTNLTTTIPTPTPQPTVTQEITAAITKEPTQVMIPPNGVWVRASYPGSYIGLIGTPGNQLEVSGTGDKFYPISTSDGIVAAALQKKDGSGDKIILEVYKNGVMLKRESTVTPKGIVEIQLDLKTVPGTGTTIP